MWGLSLVAASRGHSSSRCVGLSLSRPLLLQSTSSRRAGSVVVAHGPSCSVACGIFPDQGLNPCPLHWQADSQPLHHQGSPWWHFKVRNKALTTSWELLCDTMSRKHKSWDENQMLYGHLALVTSKVASSMYQGDSDSCFRKVTNVCITCIFITKGGKVQARYCHKPTLLRLSFMYFLKSKYFSSFDPSLLAF